MWLVNLIFVLFAVSDGFILKPENIVVRRFELSVDRSSKSADDEEKASLRSISAVTLISMPLGVLLDNQHGLFGVLTYAPSSIPFSLSNEGHYFLKSALFVPFLFGFAGAAMSFIILALDRALKTDEIKRIPSWPKVLYNISLFSFQYYFSGLMDYLRLTYLDIGVVLVACGVLGYFLFDGSLAGLLLAVATSLAGPLCEIFLTELGLYEYNHADFYKICSWIPFVYFLGGSAVGNLARRLKQDFLAENTAAL